MSQTAEKFATLTECWTAGSAAIAIEKALLFASDDETRPHMHGVKLEATLGGLRCVATNGHILAVFVAGDARPGGQAVWDAVVPYAQIETLAKWLKAAARTNKRADVPVEVVLSGREISFRGPAGGMSVTTFVDAPFPPYQQVIPAHGEDDEQGVGPIGVAGKYLAIVGQATKGLTSDGLRMYRTVHKPSKFSSPESKRGGLEPIVFAFSSPSPMIDATMVVMPMRI